MPLLFYGKRPGDRKRKLYGSNLRQIEVSIFDSFKIKHLGPVSIRLEHVAVWWWLRGKNHSAFSWHDGLGEQTIFFPQLIEPIPMIEIARTEMSGILPGPTTFRILNEDGAFLYD